MKNLLYKELRLCVPPFVFFYLGFAFMVLIPSYPYLVAFFFICNNAPAESRNSKLNCSAARARPVNDLVTSN